MSPGYKGNGKKKPKKMECEYDCGLLLNLEKV